MSHRLCCFSSIFHVCHVCIFCHNCSILFQKLLSTSVWSSVPTLTVSTCFPLPHVFLASVYLSCVRLSCPESRPDPSCQSQPCISGAVLAWAHTYCFQLSWDFLFKLCSSLLSALLWLFVCTFINSFFPPALIFWLSLLLSIPAVQWFWIVLCLPGWNKAFLVCILSCAFGSCFWESCQCISLTHALTDYLYSDLWVLLPG